MKYIELDELKKIQLDILDVVDIFCKQNGIKYSLACGTMLGAVRHNGYIPWDDDIDIYVKRTDYQRLVDIFPKSIDDVSLISMERNKKWNRSYAQVYNNKTVMKEDAYTPMEVGVYIDVYPIDEVPDDDKKWLSYNRRRRNLIHLYELKYIPFRNDRSLLKNVFLAFGKILLLPFGSRFMAQMISHYAQIHNNKGYHRSFECVQGMLQKRPFKSVLMNEFVQVPFEDRIFMAMKDYEAYLSNGYGNYMQLPPVEKRVAHHRFTAWWKE